MAMESLVGVGLTSIRDVPEAANTASVLNLHLNRLQSLEGAQRLCQLREFTLSSNSIREISELENFSHLQVLDLSGNALRHLSCLSGLRSLRELSVAYNQIQYLDGLQQLWGQRCTLQKLDLRKNFINDTSQVLHLSGCSALSNLRLRDSGDTTIRAGSAESGNARHNPICHNPAYARAVLSAVPWLVVLDGDEIQNSDLTCWVPGDGPASGEDGTKNGPAEPEMPVALATPLLAEIESNAQVALAAMQRGRERGRGHKLNEHELPVVRAIAVANQPSTDSALLARRARLRSELARVATELKRKEEWHRDVEESVTRMVQLDLPTAEQSRRRISETLAEEGAIETTLTQEFHMQLARARAIRQEEQISASEAESLMSSISATGAKSLERKVEFSRLSLDRCEVALRTSLADYEAMAATLDGSESSLRLAAVSSAEVRENMSRHEWEAQKRRRWATERMSVLSAECSSSAAVRRRHFVDAFAEATLAHDSAKSFVRSNAAAMALSEIREAPSELELMIQRLKDDISREIEFKQGFPEGQQGRWESVEAGAIARELRNVEETRTKAEAHLESSEHRQSQLGRSLKLANDQLRLGAYICSELTRELEEYRSGEKSCMTEARSMMAQTGVEEQATCRWHETSTMLQARAKSLAAERQSGVLLAPKSEYDRALVHSSELQESSRLLSVETRDAEELLQSRTSSLHAKREAITMLTETFATRRVEESKVEQTTKIKSQMVVHTMRQIEDVRAAVRNVEASQKTRDARCGSHLKDVSWGTEELAKQAAEAASVNEMLREKLETLGEDLSRKAGALEFVETQLAELRTSQIEHVSRLASKGQRARVDGEKMLSQASAAMQEIEIEFRNSWNAHIKDRSALKTRIADTRKRLEQSPAALLAVRNQLDERRRASAARIETLLGGKFFSSFQRR